MRIRETLQHLSMQKLVTSFPWEILIVDNASTDNTSFEAKQEWSKFQISNVGFSIINEPKPGLSYARRKGVINASYEYIIFCDDDNWFCDRYLQTAFDIMTANPDIGVLGGQSLAVSDIELPYWFTKYQLGYAVGKQGIFSGDITPRGFVWGAGLVTRRSLFLATISDLYPSLLNDRNGNSLTSGGDYEYCQRVILQNFRLHYDERLVFKHFIPSNRLTEEYRKKLFDGFDESTSCLEKYMQAVELKNLNSSQRLRKLITTGIKAGINWRRKTTSHFLSIFYFLFNVNIANDKDLKIIKHFYDGEIKVDR